MTITKAANVSFPALPAKLSRLVQFPTVSSYNPAEEDDSAFLALKQELRSLYPRVHEAMRREEPSDRSLLFTWQGKDASLAPAILCAHFDVVPAPEPQNWRRDPFSGDIVDGELWGRGTQDIKVLMASALEAAETLLAQGFSPLRTIYFAFGGDEEVGGKRGAGALADLLASRGVKASFLVDEGGPISLGMLGFVNRPLALIGVAEKGYADLVVRTKGSGGHASMPPRRTAPGDLARAIAAVEANPFPPKLTKTVRAFLARLAPISRQPYRFLFSQLWLTAPLIVKAFSAGPTTDALIRTTTACTMLKGSSKENVLADSAEATFNVRILPGETAEAVMERLGGIVARHGATVSEKHAGNVIGASAESGMDHEGWKAIEAALSAAHPDAACVPFLFSAGTDTKHYKDIVQATYRFSCLPQSQQDLKGVHGDNERVRLADLDRCAVFYRALVESL
jgi:carboxypeptidase PM20D1